MIGLAVSMMRVRRAHAATILVLAALAIGSAVAAPLYVRAAQRGVTQIDIDSAGASRTTILSSYQLTVKAAPGDPRGEEKVSANRRVGFDQKANAALNIPGFEKVYSVGIDANVLTEPFPDVDPRSAVPLPQRWMEYRDGVCQHVRLTAGRCPAAAGEVMVGPQLAESLKVSTGGVVYLRSMIYIPPAPGEPGSGFWAPSGEPTTLSVVGQYGGVDPGDVYFTGGVGVSRGGDEPLFTDRRTVALVDHTLEEQRVLAYPLAGTLSPDTFASVEPQVKQALATMRTVNNPRTSIVELLEQVNQDRKQVGVLPTVLELPLIILCCFVVFLAAANTAQARRVEFGMLKLRGAAPVDRLFLAAAEIVAPLIAGGVVGYLVGHLAVWLLAQVTLSVPTSFSLTSAFLPQAGLALLALIIAGLAGLRRDLVTPVADLLRRVPGQAGRWGAVVGNTVVIVAAIAAIVEVQTTTGPLTGIGILAPAAVILALGLLTSMLFDPFAGWWGRRAIRTGRLGSAMAMLHWSRRRTGTRIVALLAVATGLVGYVAIAYGIGTIARHDQVVADLGAHRVVSVSEVSMRGLFTAVHQADPDGRYAMAAMPVGVGEPTVLAVDSPRLNVVGEWPTQAKGGLDAAAVAAALRPTVGKSVTVRGSGIILTATMPAEAKQRIRFAAILAPLDGAEAQYVRLSPTTPNADTYRGDVKCPVGCRLSALAIDDLTPVDPNAPGFNPNAPVRSTTITFSGLGQTGPDAPLVTPADFDTWVDRQVAELTLESSPAGAVVTVGRSPTYVNVAAWIGPPDLPTGVLPLVAPTAMAAPPSSVALPEPLIVASPDSNQAVPVTRATAVARTSVLPRLGADGVLVDMEYLARIGEPGQTRNGGEVWLGPDAPADALDKLTAAGLTVLSVRDFDTEYAQAAGGPNSIGLQFLLIVSLLCLAVGGGGFAVAATVEMRARADELRSLRTQGATAPVVGHAARQSYLSIVVTGSVLGLAAAAIAWLLTRGRLPVMDSLVSGVTTPSWPGLTPLWTWLGASAALVVVALALSATLSSAVRNPVRRSR